VAVSTTVMATIIVATVIVCRPTSHRLLNEFDVLGLRSFCPGRIGPFHRRDAVAILVRHQQPVVTDHEAPARVRVPSVIGLPEPDRQCCQHLRPAVVG